MLTQQMFREAISDHQKDWAARNIKIVDWYRIILLDDSDLRQEDMEVVISNDPKTFFKRAVRLLSSGVTHSIPTDLLTHPEMVEVNPMVKFLEIEWRRLSSRRQRAGRHPWLYEFASFLLATGWYDILTYASQNDGLVADIRNPYECFPKFGMDGLESHIHIYSITTKEANRKCKANGWTLPFQFSLSNRVIPIYDYWYYDNEGYVCNALMMDTEIVKPETRERFDEIPIQCGPVGGLPDRGSIIPDTTGDLAWQSHVGESIVADNEGVYINENKMLSFTQQVIRDVAQPKMGEWSNTDTALLNPDTMYKRGAIFRMAPGEDIRPIGTPALPVELSLHAQKLEGMIQRGSFPWSMYGSLTTPLTLTMMNQVTAAAQEILAPFVDTTSEVIANIDNTWISQMKKLRLEVDGGRFQKGSQISLRLRWMLVSQYLEILFSGPH